MMRFEKSPGAIRLSMPSGIADVACAPWPAAGAESDASTSSAPPSLMKQFIRERKPSLPASLPVAAAALTPVLPVDAVCGTDLA
jgi:hypothetical protein